MQPHSGGLTLSEEHSVQSFESPWHEVHWAEQPKKKYNFGFSNLLQKMVKILVFFLSLP